MRQEMMYDAFVRIEIVVPDGSLYGANKNSEDNQVLTHTREILKNKLARRKTWHENIKAHVKLCWPAPDILMQAIILKSPRGRPKLSTPPILRT